MPKEYLNVTQKFRKMWESAFGAQPNEISIQKVTNQKIQVKFNKVTESTWNFDKLTNIEFDYSAMTFSPTIDTPELPDVAFKEWEIEFDRFDVRLLPFLRTEILYSAPEATSEQLQITDGVSVSTMVIYKNICFQVEDLEENPESNIKKVFMRIGVLVEGPNEGLPQILLKAIVHFANPFTLV